MSDSKSIDSFKTRATIKVGRQECLIFHLDRLKKAGLPDPGRLPISLRILLENLLRLEDNRHVKRSDIEALANWNPKTKVDKEIAFMPARVLLQDFTGVPALVDLAAMRDAIQKMGGDPSLINPLQPADLVIDHSIQVDFFGSSQSFKENAKLEFERNQERYEFLKWGQCAFRNFRVVPPNTGIVHQVNLEYLAKGVLQTKSGQETVVYPDSLVGTDSHTTMINGLGIVGWGVGGIEAEAVMLGEPIYMLMPEVIGFQLNGQLSEGVTATDLVLTVTQMLRKKGVVDKFVEFFGPGVSRLSLPDRATISNMAPEYGATIGFFPVDQETLRYLQLTGRSKEEVELVEHYMKEQDLFYVPGKNDPQYTDVLSLDLSTVVSCLAGPKRPQDRVPLSDMKQNFEKTLQTPVAERGFGLDKTALNQVANLSNGIMERLAHGSVVIAAITSCTNTSNPSVLMGAGLLAKRAVEKGLQVKHYVKTSLAPGSKVVDEYLKAAGLMPYLEQLGFHLVGYGCTTCIGNSGPLPTKVAEAVERANLVVASVLSGNRNFEGRINPLTRANYLASPPLVVAYALAGTVDIDLTKEPLGKDSQGKDVYLKDIWPPQKEVNDLVARFVTARHFRESYQDVLKGNENWNRIRSSESDLYEWKKESTYIQEPPFFENFSLQVNPLNEIRGARVLVMVGDSITTDHISPAGDIQAQSPAGQYLQELGVTPIEFNSYGSRRGNDRVMTRGTFANIRLRNLLAPGKEGSWTNYFPTNELMSIYDAAIRYKKDQTPLLVLAGKEYGTGSSRDWAAKGTALLGVKFVLAESYERIHRSNLVGMGVLPLIYRPGENAQTLGLKGTETFDLLSLNDSIKPRAQIKVVATSSEGHRKEIFAIARLDTPVDIVYYRNGGILPTVLRKLAQKI